MKISIVVPVRNEEDNISDVVRKIEESIGLEHELIVVNDHSQDNTSAIVKKLIPVYPRLRLVDNTNLPGFASALKFGFSKITGDVFVPVMGDLCDDLSTISKMVDKINEGYDIVCGSRYIKDGKRLGGSKFKGFLSSAAGWSLYHLLGIPTHDIANAFKMYRSCILSGTSFDSVGFELSMEIPLKSFYRGFKITEVPTVWKERKKGKSHFKIFKLLPSYLKLYAWALLKRMEKILCPNCQL